uniref:Biotin carboxyl carrier protein of acetyl-CoA carboxylase n=1 Tax=Melanothamnus harveyi TaxID=397005 RepID=A0A1Z1MHQ0_MELHR|nr:acetyl-CoA carboxylase biotin carboxyl carrier protein [Melanothamnus harveyi]ARW65392.1 acetyl-CoA carboxylase biotin carboxyl carrier protein [Melanothamnus harveyi]
MNRNQNIKEIITSLTKNKITKVQIKTRKTNILISKNIFNRKNPQYIEKIPQKIKETLKKDYKLQNKNEKDEIIKTIPGIYSTIVSPMVGTFYKSPAPNESPFIEVGDVIKPKQIVCIIEAMKLMNEIESEIEGEVVEILVQDGDIVDCGQALIKIKVK